MMKTEKIQFNDIIPAEYNPRKITPEDFEKLSNSIREFGFVDPIIINLKNKNIIGGHQRYKVLKDMGVAELNLVKLGDIGWAFPEDHLEVKSDTEEKALNIALNKISGEWDNSKLDSVLESLSDSDNIELSGFERLENIGYDDLNLEDYAYTSSEDDIDYYEPSDNDNPYEEYEEEEDEDGEPDYEAMDNYNYSYMLNFSTEEIQEQWFKIIDYLKRKYEDDVELSITAKLIKFIKS